MFGGKILDNTHREPVVAIVVVVRIDVVVVEVHVVCVVVVVVRRRPIVAVRPDIVHTGAIAVACRRQSVNVLEIK